jgi:hypothetical protein
MTKEQQEAFLDLYILEQFLSEYGRDGKIYKEALPIIAERYSTAGKLSHIIFKSIDKSRPNVEVNHRYFDEDALHGILLSTALKLIDRPNSRAEFEQQYMSTFTPTPRANYDEDGIPDVTIEIKNLQACYNPRDFNMKVSSADLNQVMHAFSKTREVLKTYRNRLCVTCKFKRDEDLNGNTMSEEIFCTQRGKCEPRDFGCNRHRKA